MIPKLQPRPSSRRQAGIENIFVDVNSNVDVNMQKHEIFKPAAAGRYDSAPSLGTSSEISDEHSSVATNDDIFSLTDAARPPSPPRAFLALDDQPAESPVPNHYGNEHESLQLDYSCSSSTPRNHDANTSCSSLSFFGDFSLTPPTAGSRTPLLVSAKRYGSEVRRQHNKKRRRRRRPTSSKLDSMKHCSQSEASVESERLGSGEHTDDDALCLWKGDSSDETEESNLPLLESSDEEEEHSEQIEEVVRAEHLSQAAFLQDGSFSANRAPPRKGCLSNPRPKRRRDHRQQYKTPPKTQEELEALSGSIDEHRPRRVQFGVPSAVEYEIDRPSGHLTPMSQEVTRKRYSMEPRESREEDKLTQETKDNNVILSEWEERFADDLPVRASSSRRKRRNRRSSSIFSPGTRTSLDYESKDHSNDEINAEGVASQTLGKLDVKPSNSPSNVVTTNLASLSMTPLKPSSDATDTSGTPQATPLCHTGNRDEEKTWDFAADLGSIHSKGAMEISPQNRNPNRSGQDGQTTLRKVNGTKHSTETEANTQPNTNFDKINLLGAAFGKGSPNRGEIQLPDKSTGDSSLSRWIGVSRDDISHKIYNTLLDSPWLDQEWDFFTVMKCLSFSKMKETETICSSFSSLDPSIQRVFSSTYDWKGCIERALLATSTSNARERGTQFSSKIQMILNDWKENEVFILNELTAMLECGRSAIEVAALEARRSNHALSSSHVSKVSNAKKDLMQEVSELKDKISHERSLLDILDACVALRTNVLCQATAHIGISGFSFQEFQDDGVLKLKFNHSIFDAETCVVFDLSSHPKILIEPNTAPSAKDRCSVFKFHEGYLAMLADGRISSSINNTVLRDSLLKLGLLLGKLDQCAHVFKALNDAGRILFTSDFPQLLFTSPAKNKTISMTLDPTTFVAKADVEGTKLGRHSLVDCWDLTCIQCIICQHMNLV